MLANARDIARFRDIIDARAPREFAADHIPGAVNIPALSDDERAAVGALHKQDAFAARRAGAALIAANIARHLQTRWADKPSGWSPLIYCARGGQRSGALAEIMRRIGWRPRQLRGGYKAYRRQVIADIDAIAPRLPWAVLAGKTGVGKTRLLAALAADGARALDLEALANHRGSVFGGGGAQPSQRRFESALAAALAALDAQGGGAPVFVESESRKIGAVHLPAALLAAMRRAPVARVEAAMAHRVAHIIALYRPYCDDYDFFARETRRLTPHAGAAAVRHWRRLHAGGDMAALARELLAGFYDIGYGKSLRKHYGDKPPAAHVVVNPNEPASLAAAAARLRDALADAADGALKAPEDLAANPA